jgi:molecular chaperone GrpE (heat shock protein)
MQECCSDLVEAEYVDEDKDKLTNVAFKAVVGKRSRYCRGLGVGIKPQKKKVVTVLHEDLKKMCEKRFDIEMRLKYVETQLQETRKMREELTTKFEESQRQLEEKIEKIVEAKMIAMFRQMLDFLVSI